MLERDAPLPPRRTRGRSRERIWRAGQCAWHRDCVIARQPPGPILISGPELLFDEKSAKTGAVDEKVTLDCAAIGDRHTADISRLAVHRHIDDLALDPLDALPFGAA